MWHWYLLNIFVYTCISVICSCVFMSCHHTKDHNGNKGLPFCVILGAGYNIIVYICVYKLYFSMFAFLNQNKSIYLYHPLNTVPALPIFAWPVALSALSMRRSLFDHRLRHLSPQFNRHDYRWQFLFWPPRLDRLTLNAISCFGIRVCSKDISFWCLYLALTLV